MNIFINANLTSGGTLDLTATDAIYIAKAVTVRSDFTGAGGGDMTAGRHHDQGRSDLADRRRQPSAGPPTSKVSVYAHGGDLTLEATVQGTNAAQSTFGSGGRAERASRRKRHACRGRARRIKGVTVFDDFGADELLLDDPASAGNDFIDANVTSGGADRLCKGLCSIVQTSPPATVRSDSYLRRGR